MLFNALTFVSQGCLWTVAKKRNNFNPQCGVEDSFSDL